MTVHAILLLISQNGLAARTASRLGHRRSSKDPRPMGSLWPGSERIMKANVDIGRTPASGIQAD
jgi:hypothetical protein